MKKIFSIYDAKTHLSQLIQEVKQGNEVIIGAYGKPEVTLVSYQPKNQLHIGVWDDATATGFDYEALASQDADIATDINKTIDEPLL